MSTTCGNSNVNNNSINSSSVSRLLLKGPYNSNNANDDYIHQPETRKAASGAVGVQDNNSMKRCSNSSM